MKGYSMKLPKDSNNWNWSHLERARAIAERKFKRYEDKVNLEHREPTDYLYEDYIRTAEQVNALEREFNQPLTPIE